jgi:hypothetical protein
VKQLDRSWSLPITPQFCSVQTTKVGNKDCLTLLFRVDRSIDLAEEHIILNFRPAAAAPPGQ